MKQLFKGKINGTTWRVVHNSKAKRNPFYVIKDICPGKMMTVVRFADLASCLHSLWGIAVGYTEKEVFGEV